MKCMLSLCIHFYGVCHIIVLMINNNPVPLSSLMINDRNLFLFTTEWWLFNELCRPALFTFCLALRPAGT